jgi:hypothetical protein
VTAANWNEVINDLLFLPEIGYVEYTSNVASSSTTVGTAVQVVSLGAITFLRALHGWSFHRASVWLREHYGPPRDG